MILIHRGLWVISLFILTASCIHNRFNEETAGNNMENTISKDSHNQKFFSSPKEAVTIVSKFLKKNDFNNLADYYDLKDSKIKKSELVSGDFFIRKTRPEISHPSGVWRYKHPFAPDYKYCGMRPTERKDVFIIEVNISIDQGEGIPDQEGFSFFYMRKSDKGWQVLPDIVEEKALHDMPVQL
jgi:hypothetical protein